jgi:hypothetical protein
MIVTGDVVALKVGPQSIRKPELMEMAGNLPIRLQWTRGRFSGLLKAVTGIAPLGRLYLGPTTRWEIALTDTVTFHAVGEEEPRSRRLVEVDQIILG